MRRRKLTAALLSVFALSILGAPMAQAQSEKAEKKCAPGQHGNKQPGFKPGVCR